MKFCKTCAYKLDVLDEDNIEVCPNCHNKTLIPTAENEIPKRIDLLKEEEQDADI
jgi:RNA polymerase subunit RPABC4/transcription elongation factor Spt4